jgi:hypothetical protein
VLDVESDSCEHYGATLHVCDHRFHRIDTLQGPVELPCRLAHYSEAELQRVGGELTAAVKQRFVG